MTKKTEELSREELIKRIGLLEDEILREKEANNKIKRTFISRVKHEIRTPLNSLIGFVNLLNNSHLNEIKRKLYVKYINMSMDSLILNIENLLEYAMLTAKQLELVEEKDVCLDILFDELYTIFSSEKHQQEKYSVVLLLKRKKENDKILVTCDRRRLKQIMTILMMSVLRGIRSGSIEFGYEIIDKNKIRFFISVSAEEFRTEYIGKILEDTEDPEVALNYPDINLTIVRRLIELMKGTINITTHPEGKGKLIRFDLPLDFRISSRDDPARYELKSRQDNR
ncbi:MAG TPA: HAMP domain-containing histidine kinase [Bacteroidetes bacterium]|nr:HAMP domain-containing histidine kinase [Bacteroidota bacterium]